MITFDGYVFCVKCDECGRLIGSYNTFHEAVASVLDNNCGVSAQRMANDSWVHRCRMCTIRYMLQSLYQRIQTAPMLAPEIISGVDRPPMPPIHESYILWDSPYGVVMDESGRDFAAIRNINETYGRQD